MKNPFFNLPDPAGEFPDFRLALRLVVRQALSPVLGTSGQLAPSHTVRIGRRLIASSRAFMDRSLAALDGTSWKRLHWFILSDDLSLGITCAEAWKSRVGTRKLAVAARPVQATRHDVRKIHPPSGTPQKVRDGMWVEYNKHAVVVARGVYKNDKKNGLWREYYDTGELMIEEHYLLGALHGRFATFHPNGQCCSDGAYEHGRRQGRFFMYDEDGRHMRTLTFDRDKLVGDVMVEERLATA